MGNTYNFNSFGLLGSNHSKYFGRSRRRILVMGLASAGKTTLTETLVSGKMPPSVPATKDMNIRDKKMDKLTVTFFDLAGGQRQRIFWRQHFAGAQGIIYVIDSTAPQYADITIEELENCLIQSDMCPVAVCFSKSDLAKPGDIEKIKAKLRLLLLRYHSDIKAFEISCRDMNSVNEMIKWLLSRTKAV